MTWKPIKTAPKDGTRILIFVQDIIVTIHWDGYDWAGEDGIGDWEPTPAYWMSLPKPPPLN